MPLNQFDQVKRLLFPTNPNITLATVNQINDALAMGLKVCDTGIAKDNFGNDTFATTTPGQGSMNPMTQCLGQPGVSTLTPRGQTTSNNVWVFGVKPVNGTQGVSRFSTGQWSQFDGLQPLPPRPTNPILVPTTLPPRPISNQQSEVYLRPLPDNLVLPLNQFDQVKRLLFPTDPNITLATVNQINEALAMGLQVCDIGIAKGNFGSDVFATTTPGPGSMNRSAQCLGQQGVSTLTPRGLETINTVWVFGVKPPKTVPNIRAFSSTKWSQFDRPEVYLEYLGSGMTPSAGQFQIIKQQIPYQNTTLANIQQINEALANGLLVCETGMALDNNNNEIIATTATSQAPLNTDQQQNQACYRSRAVYFDSGRGSTTRSIWVFGNKPANGTNRNVLPFSFGRWSQFDPPPPSR